MGSGKYKQLVVFSSDNRTRGSTHDFTIDLNSPFNFAGNYYLSVLKVDTWNSAANISSLRDTQVFKYNNGSTDRTFTIPEGIYTVDDLRAVIKAYMYSVGDFSGTAPNITYPIELVPNYNTGKFEIAITGVGYSIDWTASSLYRIFGTVSAVKSASYIAENVGDITDGLNNILVRCSLCAGGSLLGGSSSDVIYTYVPAAPPAAPINLETQVKSPVKITAPFATSVSIKLTDNQNRELDLRGEPFSITCLIEED